ncbi:hypothetical protein HAX54_028837 [Datura stramonium]|uniref:Uncharacterized protein n=1 Tax=Datura stramonium TaxID=4076 RepID=A0ABS8S9Y0_DATST|nr:hypothetical protein [Datura stramonium]
MTTKETDTAIKRALKEMENTSNEDSDDDKEFENESVLTMEESNNEDILVLMAIFDSDEEEKESEVYVEGIRLIPDSPDNTDHVNSIEEPGPPLTIMETLALRETEKNLEF